MMECLIIGDSIAVGVKEYAPQCVSYATGGWNSWQWNKYHSNKDLNAKTVLISLGTNDHKYINTKIELEKIRNKIQGAKVFWVLPHANLKKSEVSIEQIQNIVIEIAQKNGDTVLPIKRIQKDNIHPSWEGYKQLAKNMN